MRFFPFKLKFCLSLLISAFAVTNLYAIPLAPADKQRELREREDEQEVRLFEEKYAELLNAQKSGLNVPLFDVMENIFNFDVVVKNANYLIYRSSLLGNLGLSKLAEHLKAQNLPFPKTIVYMNKLGYNSLLPPLVGQFAIEELEGQQKYFYNFHHPFDYSFRTYVDGENPYEPTEDIDAQTYYLFGLTARRLFNRIDDPANDGGIENFMRVMETVLDPNKQPVLFHCFGGRHRTGMVGMAIRYLQGDEWVDGTKRPVKIKGQVLQLNPAQYEYYEHNKSMVRLENFAFIEKFSQDPRFIKLKETYSTQLNQ